MVQYRDADRRKYHRLATDSVISFAEVDQPQQLAVGKDVSTGGIRFEVVGCDIELGETLRITFNVMNQTIVATGLVVWATDTDPICTDVGIEFIEIDDTSLRLLEEAMSHDPMEVEAAP